MRLRLWRWGFAAAILLGCYCTAQTSSGQATSVAASRISSGEFAIRRSSQDLSVSRQGEDALVLSFKAMAQAEWEKIQQDASGQPMQAERTYHVLSAVGPVLSVEQQFDCDCGGAHPSSTKLFRAYDLSKSSVEHPVIAKLTDIFPQDALLSALRSDPLVAGALKDAGPPPSSLSELLSAIQFKQVQVKECSYSFGADLLTDFAFYSADADYVSVRISLSHAAEVCRGQMTQIGIRLPIPASLKPDVDSAREGKSGFFMQQERKFSVSQPVHFIFTTKNYGK